MESPEQAVLTHILTVHFDEVSDRLTRLGKMIPEHTHGALRRYVVQRVPTGGFLRSVLENDLKGAAQQADAMNFGQLANIVAFCYEALPSICWGDPARYNTWLYGEDEDKEEDDANTP